MLPHRDERCCDVRVGDADLPVEQGDDFGGEPASDPRCAVAESAGETRVGRHPAEFPSGGRGSAVVVDRAEAAQHGDRIAQTVGRERIEQAEPRAAWGAPAREQQGGVGEVGRGDLGGGARRCCRERALIDAADDGARSLSGRASGPLDGGRARRGHGDEAAHSAGGIALRLSRQAGVDHEVDAGDGKRGLCQRRGDDDARHLVRTAPADDGILVCRGQLAVQLADVDVVGAGSDAAGDLGDLTRSGGEHQDVGGRIGARQFTAGGCRGAGDMVEEGSGDAAFIESWRGARRPALFQRMLRNRLRDDGSGRSIRADHRRDAIGVERRRHRDENEVVAQLAHFAEKPDQQVGLQSALVDLVDDDRVDAVQRRIVEKAAQQHARRDELDARLRADLALAADGEADPVTERGVIELGEPSCGGTGGDPSRLRDDHSSGRAVRDHRRHERGLAGAGRSADDDGRALIECRREVAECVCEREPVADALEVERRAHHPSIFPDGHTGPSRGAVTRGTQPVVERAEGETKWVERAQRVETGPAQPLPQPLDLTPPRRQAAVAAASTRVPWSRCAQVIP